MPNSRRRPRAVAKQKLADTVKQKFNELMNLVLPQYVKSNPPRKNDTIHTEADFLAAAPTLPLLVLWEKKVVSEDGTESMHPQASINEFKVDEFLNSYIDPSNKLYGGVKQQVLYYLWVALMGEESAAAHVRRQIEEQQGVSVTPAVIDGFDIATSDPVLVV